jgi:hypothetical protein
MRPWAVKGIAECDLELLKELQNTTLSYLLKGLQNDLELLKGMWPWAVKGIVNWNAIELQNVTLSCWRDCGMRPSAIIKGTAEWPFCGYEGNLTQRRACGGARVPEKAIPWVYCGDMIDFWGPHRFNTMIVKIASSSVGYYSTPSHNGLRYNELPAMTNHTQWTPSFSQ